MPEVLRKTMFIKLGKLGILYTQPTGLGYNISALSRSLHKIYSMQLLFPQPQPQPGPSVNQSFYTLSTSPITNYYLNKGVIV